LRERKGGVHGFVTLFAIGARAPCRDGDYGEVICVVIYPVTREVTHLVVELTHRQKPGRLVLLVPVGSSNDGVLRCTMNEFEQLEFAEETDFRPRTIGYLGYNLANVLPLTYCGVNKVGVSPPVTCPGRSLCLTKRSRAPVGRRDSSPSMSLAKPSSRDRRRSSDERHGVWAWVLS
jgi:hypothetical protein